MIRFLVIWLQRCLGIDDNRLRVRLYLHQGLDVHAAMKFWAEVADIPVEQFVKP